MERGDRQSELNYWKRTISHVVFGNQGEESREGLGELGTECSSNGSNEVTSRGDQDRIIFCGIFSSLLVLILVWILLAERFLFQDLDGNVAEGFRRYDLRH